MSSVAWYHWQQWWSLLSRSSFNTYALITEGKKYYYRITLLILSNKNFVLLQLSILARPFLPTSWWVNGTRSPAVTVSGGRRVVHGLEGYGERGKGRVGRVWAHVCPCWCGRGEVLGCIWRAGTSQEKQLRELLDMFFLDVFSSHLHFLFLLNITEDTGLVFLKILQCLLGL